MLWLAPKLPQSIVVKDYYLAHRPLVGGANVLGISCTTNEITDTNIFANQIVQPVLQWLTNNPTKHPQCLILFPDLPSRVWTTNGSGDYLAPAHSVAYGISTNVLGVQPFVTSINMGLDQVDPHVTNDCIAYINKLASFGTNGQLIISASAGGYGNTNYVLDDIRHGTGYGGPGVDRDFSDFGATVSSATNGVLAAGVPQSAILFFDGLETLTNGVPYNRIHPTGMTNLAAYMSWGSHSSLGNEYPRNGTNRWVGQSGWWIIETIESFNGWRHIGQGNFTQWFSQIAFGGTNYENTPVGAVSHTDEPNLPGVNNAPTYFGLWASGKSFVISAWASRRTERFQAVGDPFVKK